MTSRSLKLGLVSLGFALAIPMGARAQTGAVQPANPSPQVQQPDNGGVNWKGAGIGAATLLANVGYIPAKTVYAILGGIAGGAGYALTGGNQQTANSIWRSSLGGDYVLTPDMIQGSAPIHFSGPSNPTPQANQPMSSAAPGYGSSGYNAPANTSAPPVTASSAPVYPSTPSYSSPASGSHAANVGAPPLSVSGSPRSYSSSSSGRFSTSITGPGDSGTGPVREHDIE